MANPLLQTIEKFFEIPSAVNYCIIDRNKIIYVKQDQISYVEEDDKKMIVHLSSGKRFSFVKSEQPKNATQLSDMIDKILGTTPKKATKKATKKKKKVAKKPVKAAPKPTESEEK